MPIYVEKTRIIPIADMIALADVKRALNILDNVDDDEIKDLIEAAFNLAESYCQKCFSKTSVSIEATNMTTNQIMLPFGGNITIKKVMVDDVELNPNQYKFFKLSGRLSINAVSKYDAVYVDYECGSITLPSTVSRGIKFLVSTMFNSGQDFVAGLTVESMPMKAQDILASEKYYVT